MPNDIRLIAVDLDGTLLNSRKQVSEEDRSALAEAAGRGLVIVPTTGRNYAFALPVLEPLGFATTLVCSNGAIVRSSSGATHFQRLLPRALARQILHASEQYHQFAVLMYDHDGTSSGSFAPLQMLSAPDGQATAFEYDRSSGATPPPLRSIADSMWARKNHHLISQVERLAVSGELDPLEILYAGPLAAMRELFELLRREFAGKAFENAPAPPSMDDAHTNAFSMMRTEYPSQNFSMLDVIHGRCSKGTALAQLGKQMGIDRAQIMAIGDNFNDLDMLEFAGLPVVMGNATSEFRDDTVARRGWRLTRDCDSHGVAHALREYVL